MRRSKLVVGIALPAVLAAVALLCLAGGAYAHGQATEAQALAVSVDGPGTVSGTGISCRDGTGDCVEIYTDGTVVTLTATPDAGATFTGWSGDCSGTATTCTLTLNTAKAVAAEFTTGGGSPTLTVTSTGTGTVTGTGISCGNGAVDCSETYTTGTVVTLIATPAAGATFTGWGGACGGISTTCTVTMNASTSVSATFSGGAATATLTVSVTGSGKVTGPGITCGSGSTDCSEVYAVGTPVTLVETPNAGVSFSGWGGSCTGTATTCMVSMTASRTVTAAFGGTTPPTTQATLTVTVTGSGRVTGPGIDCGLGSTDCSEIYGTNTSITLVETPASGASFVGWGGSCTGSSTSCAIVMTVSKTLTANFSQGSTQKILTVTVGGAGRVSGTGISCGTSTRDCSSAYNSNAPVTLTATPAAGAVFLGWGGACSGTVRTCRLVMDSPKAVSASFSTPGGSSTSGTFAARSLGSPVVVRTSVGWAVTLHFYTSRPASALLRLTVNGRVVNAFTFSPRAGDVLVGPFNVARQGSYKFRLTLSDGRGAVSELIWKLCLSLRGCSGAFRPVGGTFVRNLGVTASRTASGWLVKVRFQAGGAGAATIRISRGGSVVSSGSFSFHRGPVIVDLPAKRSGFHQIVLTARNASGRTYQLRWNVLLS